MKLKYTILLVLLYTCNLLAANTKYADDNAFNFNTSITEPGNEAVLNPPTIATADDSSLLGGGIGDEDETLDSVLSYFILIFFSVLIIILIDNRNLEKRYKKLVADFKTKEHPTL
ncbi:hypothetical protein [uncultured Kordia sp.]|uniref:hypothetical protein n=1 Tax=uncultured Kordia sp. TaxID=507699 RepID=UPI002629F7D5|nr:hypothetical protein [uncultured Kordia sp.]